MLFRVCNCPNRLKGVTTNGDTCSCASCGLSSEMVLSEASFPLPKYFDGTGFTVEVRDPVLYECVYDAK
jgi:hypothetical protein